MGRRLDRWRTLAWRDKARLLICVAVLWIIHAGLACFGYVRMRRIVERCSGHPNPRQANANDIAKARSLAMLAAIAGKHGMLRDDTCLRRALLVHGWLRWRGLNPVLHLGVAGREVPFRAHAWVELEGAPLMQTDAGYRPFVPPANHIST